MVPKPVVPKGPCPFPTEESRRHLSEAEAVAIGRLWQIHIPERKFYNVSLASSSSEDEAVEGAEDEAVEGAEDEAVEGAEDDAEMAVDGAEIAEEEAPDEAEPEDMDMVDNMEEDEMDEDKS